MHHFHRFNSAIAGIGLASVLFFTGGAVAYASGGNTAFTCPTGTYMTGLYFPNLAESNYQDFSGVTATCVPATMGAPFFPTGGGGAGVTCYQSPGQFGVESSVTFPIVGGVPTALGVQGTCAAIVTNSASVPAVYSEDPTSWSRLDCPPNSFLNYFYFPNAWSPTQPGLYLSGGCQALPPTASLSAAPTTVNSGGATHLNWGSVGASNCTAGGPWSNASSPLSGSGWGNSLFADAIYTFQCSAFGGFLQSLLQSVTVRVNTCNLPWGGTIADGQSVTAYQSASSATCPSETRVCQGSTLSGTYQSQNCTSTSSNTIVATLTATPSQVKFGKSSVLTWTSQNATECDAVGGFTTGGMPNNATGVSVGPITSVQNYQIFCFYRTAAGDITNQAYSNIATVTVPTPISINASQTRVPPGSQVTISWTSTLPANSYNCQLLGPNVPALGNLTFPGSQKVVINSQSVYTISCTDPLGGTPPPAVSVRVNITGSSREF
ncbi:hypothetical protein KGM48_01325 [Patescibacteria group bacterium]|nr:hypothetical protein [Patescibacteria group bacterium]